MVALDLHDTFEPWARSVAIGFSGGRDATVGSSEIGACARSIGYRKHGVPVDKDYIESSGFIVRGNTMEDHVLVPMVRYAIEAAGGRLLFAGQDDQLRLVSAKKKLSATPDGVAVDMPRDCLALYGVADIGPSRQVAVEFKSIDPRFNSDKLPKPGHVDQVNQAMGLMSGVETCDPETGETYVLRPEYALVVYMDASDYSKITPFAVKYDPAVFTQQAVRAAHIMGVDDPELLRPEGKIMGGSECKFCAHARRCLGYSPLVPRVMQQPPPKVVEVMRGTAKTIQDLKDKIRELQDAAALEEANLKEQLIDAGTKFVDGGDFKLAWSTSEGRTTTDTKAMAAKLQELGIDPKTFERKSKGSESLKITT